MASPRCYQGKSSPPICGAGKGHETQHRSHSDLARRQPAAPRCADRGQPAKLAASGFDEKVYQARLCAAVGEVCRRRAALGIDIVNDGEFGKATRGVIDYEAWSSYAWARLSGWEPGEAGPLPTLATRRDRQKFAEFYRELDATSFLSSSAMAGRRSSPDRSPISGSARWRATS
jgi:hypothetical protein